MPSILIFLIIAVCINAYKVNKYVVPLDSAIEILRCSDSNSKRPGSYNFKEASSYIGPLDSPNIELRPKKIELNWTRSKSGINDSILLPFEVPNTAIIYGIEDIASFPVLSIDYGSRFIGLSIHHMGTSQTLREIVNIGDVELMCDSIYSIIRENIRPPTRYIIVVGFPFARDRETDGRWLFQSLYNLDFATRLSRYIQKKHMEIYGNFEHMLNDQLSNNTYSGIKNECVFCRLDLGICPYNKECSEYYLFSPSDYGSAAVVGISEEFTTYQTETCRSKEYDRVDSLSSQLIFRNLIEAMHDRKLHRMPFLVLPSNNNIFPSHEKSECLKHYKSFCARISSNVR